MLFATLISLTVITEGFVRSRRSKPTYPKYEQTNTNEYDLIIGTYNTELIPTNPRSTTTMPNIISEVLQSDIDILCLNELFTPAQTIPFQTAVSSAYPYAYSEVDELDMSSTKSPCSAEQASAYESECLTSNGCTALYPDNPLQFVGCMSYFCPDEAFLVTDTDCQSCVVFYVAPYVTDLSMAASVTCREETNPFGTALTDGVMILSKYPIINQWHFPIPSSINHRGLAVAEIDVSSITGGEETDALIFGCTHLQPTDGQGPYFASSQFESDAGFISYNELNAWQIGYILDNILDEEIAPWNDEDDHHNIIARFIVGDLNIGTKVFPENLERFEVGGYNAFRFKEGDVCTYCGDVDESFLPNTVAVEGCDNEQCVYPDADIDHILIHEEDEENIEAGELKLRFTELYGGLPLSDHWGISMEIKFKNKENDDHPSGSDDGYGQRPLIGRLYNGDWDQ